MTGRQNVMAELKKMELTSTSGASINLEALYQICPSAFIEVRDEKTGQIERKINFTTLRELLGDNAYEGTDEEYGFNWVGKRAAQQEAGRPINKTLRPCPDESEDWLNTQNLYIEGDNLDVLKLLQKSYLGAIKMIYIDPPYNTGKEFIYHDNFAMSADKYDLETGNTDEFGNQYRINNDTNARFHSDWCSMMYERLSVAQSLLSYDGIIFISISDAEAFNLKLICDKVFGASNYLGDIIWNSTKSVTNTALISVSHTYNFVYCKNISYFVENRAMFRVPDDGEGFENPDNDPRGPWKADPFQVGGWRPNQQYEIVNPNTGEIYRPNPGCSWKNDYNKFKELLKDNRIVFGKTGNSGPQRKRFKFEAEERGKVVKTIWDDVETTTNGTQLLKKLFDGVSLFDNPKPVGLILRMLQLGSEKDSIILDFFSGSATTAHAVMQLNADDKGKRKYIMVQIPEKTEPDSPAYEAGYKNICELGKARIRRAGKKIKSEHPEAKDLDIGFRVFKLAESNMEDVYFAPSAISQGQIAGLVDNVKPDRTDLDLLFGCMLDWGVQLSLPLSTITVAGKKIYNVNDGDLVACFADGINEDVINAIAELNPLRVVFKDSGFESASLKINLFEIFKQKCGWSEDNVIDRVHII